MVAGLPIMGRDILPRLGSKAAEICSQMSEDLIPYERFLLLLAIQVHDIANITGRAEHENRIDEVWTKVFGPLGFDSLDKAMAIQIASTHGGTFEGRKSTLRAVERDTKYKGIPIRPRLLAAILKLADELAEEVDRASLTQLEMGTVPKESEVYHVYSSGLHTTHLDSDSGTVELKFSFSNKWFKRQLGKGKGEQYLLDEIYSRTLKTWSEAIYCSRHLPNLLITTVDVDIQIFDSKSNLEVERVKFRLEDSGYPSVANGSIYDVCAELSNFRGKGRLTAASLLHSLELSQKSRPRDQEEKVEAESEGLLQNVAKTIAGFFK